MFIHYFTLFFFPLLTIESRLSQNSQMHYISLKQGKRKRTQYESEKRLRLTTGLNRGQRLLEIEAHKEM